MVVHKAPFEPLGDTSVAHLARKILSWWPSSLSRSSVLCQVHDLRLYLDRTQSFTSPEQLFVCFGGQQKKRSVSKQRLAHWTVDAITIAYWSQDLPCPLAVRAYSTRGVAYSWALAQGASLLDICRAAVWAMPNTFARFYNLRVDPVSACVLHGTNR